LAALEADVASARARLARDLDTLRAPETTREFTQALKNEAIDAKDSMVASVTNSARSTVADFVEDLKAKAAANPAAVVAIGAGIGWKLLRHPPITTVLIGAGLYSLFKARPARTHLRSTSDYMTEAKTNLRRQAEEGLSYAKERASEAASTVQEYAASASRTAVERASEWSETASESATQAALEWRARANAAQQDLAQNTRQWVRSGKESLNRYSGSISARASSVAGDQQARDTLLLGAAGVAVAAAVGLAYQKRSAAEHQKLEDA
jgi:hypothetical protein